VIIIGAWRRFERNTGLIEALLQASDSLLDRGTGILVNGRLNVGVQVTPCST